MIVKTKIRSDNVIKGIIQLLRSKIYIMQF